MYIFLLIIAGIIGIGGWYVLSPVFLNQEVSEAFPTAEMLARDPSLMADVPPDRLETMRESILDAAAKMPDTTVQEDMVEVASSEDAQVTDNAMPEQMPPAPAEASAPAALLSGLFSGADSFHQGSGDATVYRLADGSLVLRLENFSVTNGPDLRVLLARDGSPSGSTELAPLKGNRGDQNYSIPQGTDISQYNSVIIYCKPFRVTFATAPLQ